MRTYDKLIATIFARQTTGDLRSFSGMPLMTALGIGNVESALISPQAFG